MQFNNYADVVQALCNDPEYQVRHAEAYARAEGPGDSWWEYYHNRLAAVLGSAELQALMLAEYADLLGGDRYPHAVDDEHTVCELHELLRYDVDAVTAGDAVGSYNRD